MNVAIIPCFDRPEFLSVTVELIQKAKRADEFVYLFSLDNGFDRTCKEVIKAFPLEKVIIERKATSYRLGKQSYNLLNAYAEACYLTHAGNNQEDKVVLIEDDIFINPDFFNWHLQVHEKEPGAFCSIASENHNTHYKTEDSEAGYYHGAETDYVGWGTMFRSSVLEKFILPHANAMYFKDPNHYINHLWKYDWIGPYFTEQDGLIRRIRYDNKTMPVIFAHKPRCFHAGFYSYHRNLFKRFHGSLEQRIEKIKETISDPEKYKAICENPAYYNDSRAIDLEYEFKNKNVKLLKAELCQ